MLSKSGSRKCVSVPENSYSITDKYSFVANNFYCRDTMRRTLPGPPVRGCLSMLASGSCSELDRGHTCLDSRGMGTRFVIESFTYCRAARKW